MLKVKKAKQDCTVTMLPQNRKQVFFDVIKLHWRKFLLYALLVLLFTLPIHAVAVYEDIYVASFNGQYTPENEEAIYQQILLAKCLFATIKIVPFLILAIGLSGMVRVIRQHAWEENVYFGNEFGLGIKQNIGQMLLLAFLVGIIFALSVFAVNMSQVSSNQTVSLALLVPVGISIFLDIPIASYAFVAMSIYKNSFWENIVLAFTVTVKSPFRTLLALLCCAIPFVPQMIPNFYCHIIGRVVASLLIPFIMLGWYLFALNQFDKFVNKDQFPKLVGKGTFAQNPTQTTEQATDEENN